MKKIILLLFLLSSSFIYADDYISLKNVNYNNLSMPTTTAKKALKFSNNKFLLLLEGKIVKDLGNDIYLFKDDTAEIQLLIPKELFNNNYYNRNIKVLGSIKKIKFQKNQLIVEKIIDSSSSIYNDNDNETVSNIEFNEELVSNSTVNDALKSPNNTYLKLNVDIKQDKKGRFFITDKTGKAFLENYVDFENDLQQKLDNNTDIIVKIMKSRFKKAKIVLKKIY